MSSAPVADPAERDALINEAARMYPEPGSMPYAAYGGERSTEEMSDAEINAIALPFEEAEPPENEPDEWADRDPEQIAADYWGGQGPEWEAQLDEHERETGATDAREFEEIYGEPPTPAEEREAGG